ncbi:hypothetical protein [Streptosporangium sp. 'caverna']|uniref:hypothetical protein n=1 Tax=Streptosporangium sp. 'caverna' TaxID=2202249 RepID=UPI0013A6B863|nr:hypothetical protein [Streptosporangium sp. 'caverna']
MTRVQPADVEWELIEPCLRPWSAWTPPPRGLTTTLPGFTSARTKTPESYLAGLAPGGDAEPERASRAEQLSFDGPSGR